jgi:hypothetical protein
MRAIADRNILDSFCTDFCDIVQRHCKYIVVSGFVAISSGRTRATEDIDMIIEKLSLSKFKVLHADLIKAGFICMQSDSPEEIYSYLAEEKASVRYTLRDQPLPEMEVKFAKDELDLFQIQTRVKLPLTGLDIWFGSVNMNIAFKEELLKSDKDLKDAEHLRKIYPELVDEEEIKHIKKMIHRYRL